MNNEEKILGLLESMQANILQLKNDVDARFDNIETEIKNHRIQTKENTEMLIAMKHAVETIDAKVTAMEYSVAKIEGEVTGLKKDLATVEEVTSSNWNYISKLKNVNNG